MVRALRFYQLADGYAYNSDSLLLIDFAARFLATNPPKKVLDMGAGCGILGIFCAYHFRSIVLAIERNPIVAALAAINAATAPIFLSYDSSSAPLHSHVLKDFCASFTHIDAYASNIARKSSSSISSPHSPSSMFIISSASARTRVNPLVLCANFLDDATPQKALALLQILCSTNSVKHDGTHTSYNHTYHHARFDALIANPPFYHENTLKSSNTHIYQARYASELPLRAWICQSKKMLSPRGALIFCYHASDMLYVLDTLRLEGFTCEALRLAHPHHTKRAKLALFYARLDSKAKLVIEPPIFTHNSTKQSDFTHEAMRIYQHYRTHSIKVYARDIDMHFIQNTYSHVLHY